ncbi:acetate uptake transporter [Flavobacterium myungsuense]|uniref:Acetate uptake transporter n=1 Tax=Flavobacterium myungsuense TaxID=651823 RepID=A0ABW3J339_9FLAO
MVLLFALLSVARFTGNKSILNFSGYEGIICGSFAFYKAAVLILNEKIRKFVLPL